MAPQQPSPCQTSETRVWDSVIILVRIDGDVDIFGPAPGSFVIREWLEHLEHCWAEIEDPEVSKRHDREMGTLGSTREVGDKAEYVCTVCTLES